jgi:hypothetical protein
MTIVFEPSYCNVYGTGYQLRYVYRKQWFWDCGGIHNGHFEFVIKFEVVTWSVIKNSAEDVSDERAIDVFSSGLRRSDLVEEIGRTRPKTVSELMEVANRFTDGEDAYNNKRGCSPEVDRTSRQRRRYRNGDNHARRNQVAAGYERMDEEGYENKEFQARGKHDAE